MRHTPGREIELHYSVSCDNSKMTELICKPREAVEVMLKDSIALEEQIANQLFCKPPAEWANQANITGQLQRALEYVRVKPVQHTENSWVARGKNDWQISNMVYRMSCSIYEHTTYDRVRKEQIPDYWHVTWRVSLNPPYKSDTSYNGKIIDSQENKRYTDKAAAEKYLQGRVAAYAHLFTELCPPVPNEYRRYFSLYSQPLPGYAIQPSDEAVLTELLQFVSDDDLLHDSPPMPTPTKDTPIKPKKPMRRNQDSR